MCASKSEALRPHFAVPTSLPGAPGLDGWEEHAARTAPGDRAAESEDRGAPFTTGTESATGLAEGVTDGGAGMFLRG
jgi:hypothetical protein